ncbi:ATP-binding protein [Sutcliffiella sp. NPDC057660]|uniref:ATP-binding protein n=1 Tax=Sutcliffiella sp. NPDC057660 TaxID=3346199 RepID=UPI00368E6D75
MLDNYIAKVRERCLEYKLDPNVIPVFTRLSNEELARIQGEYKARLHIIRLFMDKFLGKSKGIPLLVAVTDDKGNIIEYMGDESLEDTVVNQIGLQKGVQFTEEKAGVNSVLAALELQMPVQVIGDDHYYQFLHLTACYSVPLFLQKKVIGTISMMTFLHVANPMIMASLETVVDSIERELDLREQNRYLDEMNQMILEQSKTGYIVLDESGSIVKVNPKAKAILDKIPDYSSIKDILQLREVHEQYKKQDEELQDYEIILQNGTENRTCLVDFFPFQAGTLIQIRDITEYKLTEAYIQNAEKLSIVGHLAAGVAHEIKNPLTTLKGFIQLVQENRYSDTYPAIMLNEIERIDQITNEFLVLSRPTVQAKDWYDVRELVKEIGVLLSSFAISKNIEITHSFKDIEPIFCDANQLKQVFINLVKNSVEAVGHNGRIDITVESPNPESILIRFMDDGDGFPEHILKRMGQPFLTTKEDGNGLGVMVCKRIVETIHNGQLIIHNKQDGGAIVDIILPQT